MVQQIKTYVLAKFGRRISPRRPDTFTSQVHDALSSPRLPR